MRYSENPKQYRKDYYTNHKEIINETSKNYYYNNKWK